MGGRTTEIGKGVREEENSLKIPVQTVYVFLKNYNGGAWVGSSPMLAQSILIKNKQKKASRKCFEFILYYLVRTP